jgi:hypothetical protein
MRANRLASAAKTAIFGHAHGAGALVFVCLWGFIYAVYAIRKAQDTPKKKKQKKKRLSACRVAVAGAVWPGCSCACALCLLRCWLC